MNQNDISSQTEKYKQELMRLYGKSTSSAPKQPSADAAALTPPQPAEESDYTQELNERFPEPDLSGLSDYPPAENFKEEKKSHVVSEKNLGTEKGYILVNVRTGDSSEPIEGASVSVEAVSDGNRFFIASGITDESGTSPKFDVPAPETLYSQSPNPDSRPYNLYDVSVSAKGFFNARSVDVPVFAGITSVQSFSMIPLPLFMNAGDETVTYFNQEPNLSV